MAEQGARAAREHRRELTAARRDGRMAERIDAAVEAVKPPGPQPASDRTVAQPELAQLAHAHDAVLATGERRDRHVWTDFPIVCAVNSAHTPSVHTVSRRLNAIV
jgi:hypothetical protein